MQKRSILLSLLLIVLLILNSCSMDTLTDAMDKFGNNVLGTYNPNIGNIEAGKTSANDLIANNDGLKDLFESLNGNSNISLDDVVIVPPLSDKDLNDLKINYSNGSENLSELKTQPAKLSEQDKEGVQGTAEFVDGYLSDIKTDSMEDGPVKDLVTSLQTTIGEIVTNPDNAKAGDVIALKYTVTLLDKVAEVAGEGIEIEKDVNGESVPITVKSSDIINALFGNESETNPNEPKFELEDFQKLIGTNEGSEIVGEVESYLNIVSSVSNLTGNVDVSSIIGQFLK